MSRKSKPHKIDQKENISRHKSKSTVNDASPQDINGDSIHRIGQNADSISIRQINYLQQTLGNQAVTRFIAGRVRSTSPIIQRFERKTLTVRSNPPMSRGGLKTRGDNVIQRSEVFNLKSRGVGIGYVTYSFGGKDDSDKLKSEIKDHYESLDEEHQTMWVVFEQVYNYSDPSQKKNWFKKPIAGVGVQLIKKVLDSHPDAKQIYVTGAVPDAQEWYGKKGFNQLGNPKEMYGSRESVYGKVGKFDSIIDPGDSEEWLDLDSPNVFSYDKDDPLQEWS